MDKKKGKILVFDDELESLSKIYINLLIKNFEVEVTANPNEIVPRAQRLQPELAIINNEAQGFNGSDVCAIIKEQLKIPIALLVDKYSAATLYIDSCKADEIINKPVSINQLMNIIYKLIQKK